MEVIGFHSDRIESKWREESVCRVRRRGSWGKKSVAMNHEFPRNSVDSFRIEIEVHYPIILGL